MDPAEWFLYNSQTGTICWAKDRGLKIKRGTEVRGLDKDGYLRAKLDGKTYKAHRLAWYLYYGVWPTHEIDHINRVRSDNRIVNLRDVPRRENGQNLSGYCGVGRKYNGWQAQTSVNGSHVYIGFSKDKETAINLYRIYMEKNGMHYSIGHTD